MSYRKGTMSGSRSLFAVLFLCFALAFASATQIFASSAVEPTVADLRAALSERIDLERFAAFEDPAANYFDDRSVRVLLELSDAELEKHLDEVINWQYNIPFGQGKSLRVLEAFTLRSWLAPQRRAALFLNGSVFVGNNFAIPVEGYDAMAMAARRGMFAFAFDYIGTGGSYTPEDGTEVGFYENTVAAYAVVWYIRNFRLVKKIDLYGEGYGGSIATQLAADRGWIRSCVMSAMLYRELAGGPLTDPAFVEALEQAPNGYVFMPPEAYIPFAVLSPVAVQEYLQNTQTGSYPALNLLVAAYLPFYDPGVARAPGLAIYGEFDPVGGPTDRFDLTNDYGTHGAELVILEGAGHAPRTESPETVARLWDLVFDFWN